MRAREEGATGVMVVLLLMSSGRGASGAAIVLLRAMRAAMGGRDGSDESAKAPTLADRDSGWFESSGAPVGVCPRCRRVMPVKVVYASLTSEAATRTWRSVRCS